MSKTDEVSASLITVGVFIDRMRKDFVCTTFRQRTWLALFQDKFQWGDVNLWDQVCFGYVTRRFLTKVFFKGLPVLRDIKNQPSVADCKGDRPGDCQASLH